MSKIQYNNQKIQYHLKKLNYHLSNIDDDMSLENKELFLSIFDRVFNSETSIEVDVEDSINLIEQFADEIQDKNTDSIDTELRLLN